MAESFTKKKRSNNEGYLGPLPRKKVKSEPEVNKYTFSVLLHSKLENAGKNMSVEEFVRTVRCQAQKEPVKKNTLETQVYV